MDTDSDIWLNGIEHLPPATGISGKQRKGNSEMGIRCKMNLQDVIAMKHGGTKAIFSCQYDPKVCEEDKGFSKFTPTGMAEYQIDNPTASAQLVIGQDYYFDITPVPEVEAAVAE